MIPPPARVVKQNEGAASRIRQEPPPPGGFVDRDARDFPCLELHPWIGDQDRLLLAPQPPSRGDSESDPELPWQGLRNANGNRRSPIRTRPKFIDKQFALGRLRHARQPVGHPEHRDRIERSSVHRIPQYPFRRRREIAPDRHSFVHSRCPPDHGWHHGSRSNVFLSNPGKRVRERPSRATRRRHRRAPTQGVDRHLVRPRIGPRQLEGFGDGRQDDSTVPSGRQVRCPCVLFVCGPGKVGLQGKIEPDVPSIGQRPRSSNPHRQSPRNSRTERQRSRTPERSVATELPTPIRSSPRNQREQGCVVTGNKPGVRHLASKSVVRNDPLRPDRSLAIQWIDPAFRPFATQAQVRADRRTALPFPESVIERGQRIGSFPGDPRVVVQPRDLEDPGTLAQQDLRSIRSVHPGRSERLFQSPQREQRLGAFRQQAVAGSAGRPGARQQIQTRFGVPRCHQQIPRPAKETMRRLAKGPLHQQGIPRGGASGKHPARPQDPPKRILRARISGDRRPEEQTDEHLAPAAFREPWSRRLDGFRRKPSPRSSARPCRDRVSKSIHRRFDRPFRQPVQLDPPPRRRAGARRHPQA